MRKVFPEKRMEKQYMVIQIQSIYDISLNLDSINRLKKQNPHDERDILEAMESLLKREEWEYICVVIFPKDPASKAFVADSNVRLLDPGMLKIFYFEKDSAWQRDTN